MCIEGVAFDVAHGRYAKQIALCGIDMRVVVRDVDGNKDAAGQDGDTSEEGAKEAQEAQEGYGIKTDLV